MEKFPTQAASAWFPLLPKGWAHSRIKYEVARIGSGGTPNTDDDLLWARDGSGTAWVSIADMSTADIVNTTERRLTAAGLASKNLETFPPGTLLYSMYASVGKISILGASAAINQAMLAILPDAKKIDARFFRWALEYVSDRILELASTNTQDNLNLQKVRNAFLLRPPMDVQTAIANFLDRETAEADALVAKYERLIELLEEKRVALITQAVTKGLDPTVPMKDSRVEWIGDIPAHWRVIRLKLTTDSLQTGPFGTVFQSNEYISEGIPMINPTHFADGLIRPSTEHTVSRGTALRLSRYAMLQGDVLYARRGDTKKYGLVKLTQNGWVCGSDVIRVRVKRDRISPDFLAAYTASTAGQEFLMHSANGTTMDGINPSQLGNLSVPIPPTAEQSLIVESIALACNDFENIKKSAAMAVSLALERRSALITAAVIGQIDVAAYRPKQQAQELPA